MTSNLLNLNKKASLKDTIFVPIYLLTVAATVFVAIFVWYSFQSGMTDMLNISGVSPATNTTIMNAMSDIRTSLNSIDYMFPFLVIGFMIISLIFAFRSGASVLYAFLSIVFWGFALLISAVITNVFGLFQTSFPTVASNFPIIVYIMNNMKFIVLGWLVLISIVMFTRNKDDETRMGAMNYQDYGGAFD